MIKNIFKKLIITLMMSVFVLAVFFEIAKRVPITPGIDDQVQTSVFNNGFFDTNLTKANKAEPMVTFSQIQTIIVTHMNQSFSTPDARDTSMLSAISTLVGTKRIAIETADDLYNFSTAVSWNWINTANYANYFYYKTVSYLLDQDYALVSDIDYRNMRAKTFNPIGIDLDLPIDYDPNTPGEQDPIFPFTGSFDGQGFSISNLYVSGYSYVTVDYSFDGTEQNSQIFSLIQSYSMFALIGETGVVKNLTVRNPNFELLDAPEGLTKAAMFVGTNHGTIYNVSVIDTKTNAQGASIAGIRFNVLFVQAGTTFTAAGFAHTNAATGKIYNSFFISDKVMADGSRSRFNVRPFVYTNSGTISGVAYDQLLIPNVDSTTLPQSFPNYTQAQFRSGTASGSPISINNTNLQTLYGETRQWNYYVQDGFPILFKLTYVSGAFEIANEMDLIAFNKLINYNTPYNGITYDTHNYRLTDDVDMRNIKGYVTPTKEFKGTFSGGTSEFSSSSTNTNKYIYNMTIDKPVIIGNNYYMGLFSILSGTVRNINLMNNQMNLTLTAVNYGRTFNVGSIAGVSTGTIRNIVSDTDIQTGTAAIGRSYIGGIAGSAQGSVTYVANLGIIDGNAHNFNNLTINGLFSIGGILGSTTGTTLILTNSINLGEIRGIGLASGSQFNVAVGSSIQNRVGGIIGEVNNTASTNHSFYYVTNEGKVAANDFTGKSGGTVQNFIGGIFGEVQGLAFQITNPTNPITFRNGRWQNKGIIEANHINTFTTTNSAGIGVVSTSTTKAEFTYMTNSGGFNFPNLNYQNHNTYVFYSATILDNSTGGVKLSRAYNTANFTFGPSYFNNTSGITVTTIRIAPFFVSKSNIDSELLFVDNLGELYIGSTDQDSNVANTLQVAGITLATKIDYKNVSFTGTKVITQNGYYYKGITLIRMNNSFEVFVAGITYALPYDTTTSKAYTMQNVINKGNIIVADFKGNTTMTNNTITVGSNTGNGTQAGFAGFATTIVSRNLYIAGVSNLNVGQIRNAMNYGEITSTLNSTYKDIDGNANTFVGGITTFNYNLIQDAANTGLIHMVNSSTSSISYVSSSLDPLSTSALFAGMTYGYTGGVVAGGISAAMANTRASILTGIGKDAAVTGEVIDTANNGDIFAKAYYYVRSGGIIGVAIGVEITAGTDNATQVSVHDKKFSSNITGSQDPISLAKVSNGLNFGNISAVTYMKFNYAALSDADAYASRPGIYSAAGGVVGYGLFAMKRMLNHGIISATDVAGGIIGATYIVGSTASTTIPVSIVDIDTAVHYGSVKATEIEMTTQGLTNYNNFTYENSKNYSSSTYYKTSSYLFPDNTSSISINKKPGFGGIFGRLQRGTFGLMQSNNFVNILNMDSNIDMVGRTDQNGLGSFIYYRFTVQNRTDTYYSARNNDTSPASIVGYYPAVSITRTIFHDSSSTVAFQIRRAGRVGNYTYTVENVTLTGVNGTRTDQITRYVGVFTSSAITFSYITNNANNTIIETSTNPLSSVTYPMYTTITTHRTLDRYGLTTAQVSDLGYTSSLATLTINNYNTDFTFTTSTPTNTQAPWMMPKVQDLTVGDSGYDPSKLYIFDPSFPLMNPSQSDFIYRVTKEVLADRFRLAADPLFKNGMYVLASSKGREAGAVLPANLSINNFYGLKEPDTPVYYNLDSISVSNLNVPSVVDLPTDPLYLSYSSMFQVRKSDKSLVLPKQDQPTIGDLVLYDPTGQSPTLEGGIINNTARTIVFNVSQSAFPSSTVTYEALQASLSENAVIAVSGITSATHAGFKTAYNARTSNILGGAYKFTHTGTFSSNQVIFTMTVYSEVAADDPNLVTTYKTDYTVTINRIAQNLNVTLNQILMNSTNVTPLPSLVGSTYTVSPSFPLSPSGTITVRFIDNNTQLPLGHNLTIHRLTKDGDTVDPAYYNLTLTPKASNNIFGFAMTLSDELESGVYRIVFSYYNSSTQFNMDFTKQASSNRLITSVSYSTYSADASGGLIFTPTGTNFTTFIEFGEILEGVLLNTNRSMVVTPVSNGSSLNYVNTLDYVQLTLDGNTLMILRVSPFASITAATVRYEYGGDGRKSYIFNYTILNELSQSTVITHTVTERQLSSFIVYKDGNQQFAYPVQVTREALTTNIQIDFRLQDVTLYDNITTVITDTNGVFTPTEDEIEFFIDDGYAMVITFELGVGEKTYAFTLNREGSVTYNLGSVVIRKNLGVSAYLNDIRFQINSDITLKYPTIYQINSDGSTVTPSDYDPRVFFDGIDYDGADTAGVQYFRINGEVSDIDLSNYYPDFTLPIGAIIQRQVGPNSWSNDLSGNFTSEVEDVNTVVRYRILSEQTNANNPGVLTDIVDSTIVYYDLTVIDILYNLTIRFTLFYRFGNGTIVPAGDPTSPIKNSVILIIVKNYETEETFTPTISIDPVTGRIIYPFEGGIISYTAGVRNQSTLFYYPLPANITDYLYTFGKNKTGVYNFSIVSPKYTGVTTGNLVNGLRYDYNIYLRTGVTGSGTYPWNDDKYKLPVFDNTGEIIGKYYYVLGTNRQIIREFAIVIEESTLGSQWGLYDDYTSWDN